jgi:protein ImuA
MSSPLPSTEDAPSADGLDKAALIAALRARIARLDRSAPAPHGGLPLSPAIDAALPGNGLARAALHEVLAEEPGAAAGFCALLLARAGGTVLWIAAEPDAWPPGLARFGLAPADLILVQAARRTEALWAMEESLRCPGVAGALLLIETLDMTAARRLQLAAEAGGGIGLLLRPAAAVLGATVAMTRWRVAALPGDGGQQALGDPRWRLVLERGRGAQSQSWDVTWRAAAERLEVEGAALLRPAPRRRA